MEVSELVCKLNAIRSKVVLDVIKLVNQVWYLVFLFISEKKKNLIHKYKVSNEKDLDFFDGDAQHRFFYRL